VLDDLSSSYERLFASLIEMDVPYGPASIRGPARSLGGDSRSTAGFALVGRLGRHLLHLGVVMVVTGTVVLALTVSGARTVSTLDLAPGLFLIGLGAGSSVGPLFDFILAGVGMDEVGSASGVLEAVQQLSRALGVAVLGTIFFWAFHGHVPTHAMTITE
jgi:hypothetical protein